MESDNLFEAVYRLVFAFQSSFCTGNLGRLNIRAEPGAHFQKNLYQIDH